jgi:hypothetical protein
MKIFEDESTMEGQSRTCNGSFNLLKVKSFIQVNLFNSCSQLSMSLGVQKQKVNFYFSCHLVQEAGKCCSFKEVPEMLKHLNCHNHRPAIFLIIPLKIIP